ncbi:MAG: GNAT family N-acetyltransferase [Candidatus Planktophila sp.]
MTVLLRPYTPADFDRICEIRGLDTPERRERFIARLEKPGEWVDHYLHLAIESDGVLVGDFQLRHCDRTTPPGAWDMGLELSEDLRGKGIGTQALQAGAKYAFAHGAHRVEGSTDESNIAMRRAFEKAGWNFEGVLKALFIEDGQPHDYYSYAITKFD